MMMKSHAWLWVFVVLLFSPGLSEGTNKAPGRPNILFCIADDWGWPHAGAYGDKGVSTPVFDRIAADGIRFEYAFVSSPSCTPSRNAILTGRYHWSLGPGAQLWSTLPSDLETFPWILESAGYRIGHTGKAWGPGRLDGKWDRDEHNPAGPQFESFAAFLEGQPADRPFVFWLGTSDPHRPFDPGSGAAAGIDPDRVEPFPFFPDVKTIRSDIADYYFEVQRFDRLVGDALELLEERGNLNNTLVVMTGDHGMPFPRAKSNCYDAGVRVPLAMMWLDGGIRDRGVSREFVSLVDLAATFLDAAGIRVPDSMHGLSLLPAGRRPEQGVRRTHAVFGKERHVPAQEAPDMGGYPTRGIRTERFLYLVNYRPDRWPNGTPHWRRASLPGAWYADTDNSPTKTYIVENRDKDAFHRQCWEWCFGFRPREELYVVEDDPHQLFNAVHDPRYRLALRDLRRKLEAALEATDDPRAANTALPDWDRMRYYGGAPKHPEFGK